MQESGCLDPPLDEDVETDLSGSRYNARTLHEYREAALASLDFSRYSRLVSSLLQTKVGLITFHDDDNQFALAETNPYTANVIPKITPKSDSVCQYTVQQNNQPFVLADLSQDVRFNDLDWVTGGPELRAYAGFPILTQEGYNIGAVCALDDQQREWSHAELLVLEDIARMISNDLVLHFKTKDVLMQQRMQNSIVSFVRSNLVECNKPHDHSRDSSFQSDYSSVYDNAARILESTLDLDGVMIVDINETLRKTSSWPKSQKQPQPIMLAFRHSHPETCIDISALDRKFCVDLVNLGGSVFRASLPDTLRNTLGPAAKAVIVVPLYDSDNEPYALVIVYRTKDEVSFTSTDKQYIEAFGSTLILELQRAKFREADDAKAKFIRSLSHELRTPLHGLIHNLEILAETNLDAEQIELLQEIRSCSNLQLRVVESVLDYNEVQGASSISANSETAAVVVLEAVDVVAIVEDAVASAVYRQRRTTENQRMTGDVAIFIDCPLALSASRPRRTNSRFLKRIVHELVTNSLKWTVSGFIRIGVDIPESSDAQDVYITVNDTGSGISSDFMKQSLYKSFTKEDSFSVGLGLGLSLVSEMVHSLGGSIDVDSVKGAYTAIHLRIPMEVCSKESISNRSETSRQIGIHIRDDQTRGQNLVMKILERDLQQCSGLSVRHIRTSADLNGIDLIFASSRAQVEQLVPKVSVVVLDGTLNDDQAVCDSEIYHMCPYYGPNLLSQLLRSLEVPLDALDNRDSTPVRNKSRKRALSLCSRDAISSTHDFKISHKDKTGAATAMATPTSVETPGHVASNQVTGYFDLASTAKSLQTGTPDEATLAVARTTLTPRVKSTTFDDNRKTNPLPSPLPSPKVLIVEDNDTNARLLSRFMQKKGLDFSVVVNGLEAVQAVESAHAAGNQPFDVILMDIQMPIMDGLTATRHIRKFEATGKICKSHIVACTGLSGESDKLHAAEVGIDNFLTKPIGLSVLRNLFDEWAQKHSLR